MSGNRNEMIQASFEEGSPKSRFGLLRKAPAPTPLSIPVSEKTFQSSRHHLPSGAHALGLAGAW